MVIHILVKEITEYMKPITITRVKTFIDLKNVCDMSIVKKKKKRQTMKYMHICCDPNFLYMIKRVQAQIYINDLCCFMKWCSLSLQMLEQRPHNLLEEMAFKKPCVRERVGPGTPWKDLKAPWVYDPVKYIVELW